MKLMGNVAIMRDQLAELTGDSGNDGLPVITAEKAQEYAKLIDEVAESVEPGAAPPFDVWEALRNRVDKKARPELELELDGGEESVLAPQALSPTLGRRRLDLELEGGEEESLLGPQAFSPQLRRRRIQAEQNGEGRDEGAGGKGGGKGVQVDSATNQLVDRHRQIQDALIGEMAIYSEQMKNNSLMMEQSLKDTERVLDSTEEAVEHSLSATNRANFRAGFIYKASWKTGCFTWLMLFLMILIFVFMVGVIRMTG